MPFLNQTPKELDVKPPTAMVCFWNNNKNGNLSCHLTGGGIPAREFTPDEQKNCAFNGYNPSNGIGIASGPLLL